MAEMSALRGNVKSVVAAIQASNEACGDRLNPSSARESERPDDIAKQKNSQKSGRDVLSPRSPKPRKGVEQQEPSSPLSPISPFSTKSAKSGLDRQTSPGAISSISAQFHRSVSPGQKSTQSKASTRSLVSGVGDNPVRLRILERAEEDSDCTINSRRQSFRQRTVSQLSIVNAKMQKYSIPLVTGVVLAILWCNMNEKSYKYFANTPIVSGLKLLGHDVTLHFLVNDIFMCLFFALAIKEVTESLLPGGSLSPLHRAVNPIMATLGGVLGPVLVYFGAVYCLHAFGAFSDTMCVNDTAGHRRLAAGTNSHGSSSSICTLGVLLQGWGVPTATDISLAWMGALVIFGKGHPVINFLLLLAILDDALGMIIIAVFYTDPQHPVNPQYFLLVAGAMVLALILRLAGVRKWQVYVALSGPIAWLGLILAHVHPALALVFIIPFLPASHEDECETNSNAIRKCFRCFRSRHEHHPPLHEFEHQLKRPVDYGMFMFGLANAGVELGNVGGITVAVIIALVVGKVAGITCCSALASCMGLGLPDGLSPADLVVAAMLAGLGLTVALFVAGQAFTDPGLQGQAKMGAVFSVVAGPLAYFLRKMCICTCMTGETNDEDAIPDFEKPGHEALDCEKPDQLQAGREVRTAKAIRALREAAASVDSVESLRFAIQSTRLAGVEEEQIAFGEAILQIILERNLATADLPVKPNVQHEVEDEHLQILEREETFII